ncbi:MAG: DUF2125 domain-containing protein [Lentilitoribacter sp.]
MKPRHKLILLIASIFIIPGLVTVGWHWGAEKLENVIENRITKIADRGVTITCNNLQIRGFPFRIGLNCDNTSFDDTKRRVGLTAGELRTTAQIYNPSHVISELDGPMILTNRNSVVKANWQSMRASSVFDISNLARASIEATSIDLTTQISNLKELTNVSVENIQMHVRENENNVDIAASGVNIALENQLTNTPIKINDINIFATLHDNLKVLEYDQSRDISMLRGTKVTLHDFTIKGQQNVQLIANGPMDISDQGMISGEIAVTVKNIANLKEVVSEINPTLTTNFSNLINILSALSPQNNPNEIAIKISVRDGVARAGIIPLGRIPAI